MKRNLCTVVCLMGFVLIAAAPALSSPAWAAKGGAVRMTAPRSAMPAAPAASPKTAPNTQQANVTGQTANQTKQDAQTKNNANTQANAQTRQNTQASSPFGGIMRNMGFLAGGMFLGSMLSGLFGMGSMGFMADILGMVCNVILLLVVINVLKWLWQKLRRPSRRDDEAYRRGYEEAMREQQRRNGYTIDVKPIDEEKDVWHKK